MKLRVGACALMLILAGCSGESPESGMAGMRGVASSKPSSGLPTALPLARAIGASIANAPDRGALLSYPNKATPAKQEGAYTWYPTTISEAHAFKGVATGEMTVPAPDGSQVKLRYERHAEEIDGNWTWIGRVVGGDPMQEAIITFGEKAVFGSIPQANGKPALSLQTRNGTVFAVQTDPSKVVSATKGHQDVMIPEAAALRSSMAAAVSQSAQVSQGAAVMAQAAPPTSANTIDVAIGYTPEFASVNGGASGAATRLVFLVQVGNQAFANSDINGYLRIVHALQVNYTNTNTNQTALQELTGSTGSAPVNVPAGLAPLRTARDQYGADIALLVRQFSTPAHQGCGIAWLNGANGPSNPSQPPITAADAAWGYAVISDGYASGSDGKEYFCAPETLVHEAAHLMGSAHDRANSLNGTALQYGAYSYSFGYKTAAAAGNFYTIMAYGDVGQTAHRIFSTPLKSTCGAGGNLACGVANSEDNARSLNQTIPVVAQFRATVVPFAGGARGDLNGDGKSDILWRFQSQSLFSYWHMNGASRASSGVNGVTWSSRIVGVGDFDGDGLSDVLWVNNDNFVWIWRSRGNGTFDYLPVDFFPAGWSVAGVGDLNADGKSDIVWRNASQSLVSYWLMNGASRTSTAAFGVPSNNKIIGIGDFDGDGRADLIWSDLSETVLWMYRSRSDGGFDYISMGAYPAGWTLGGVVDLNGDARSDLIWRNAQSGLFSFWWMNGATRSAWGTIGVAAGNRIVGTGDFDGDGRGDVLWVNDAGRFAWIYRSRGDGTFDYQFVDYFSADWVISNGGY